MLFIYLQAQYMIYTKLMTLIVCFTCHLTITATYISNVCLILQLSVHTGYRNYNACADDYKISQSLLA